ncbi:WecB/TagA/CpsF family glycosyl transferase [Nitratireductor aquibiodomus RA22]|uniref:WecB/TagA/CpsF family glycosyl transferase n=1 Tax=Nitratireductor aquibiodomus RA22 TaxID=1189611 RepID=I5C833_9HYPH|nr:WecB/TagA/CpsF family glycosyltransferase [Nitratireductor aquibiodomus]EIM77985.1 WecB/TagA/CpsF family glycosyl transferase [Nitratireductor aquibiodomus RA22]
MNVAAPKCAHAAHPRRDVLGTDVSVISRDGAMALLAENIAARRFMPVTFLNAHNANVAVTDARFRDALPGFLVLADGIGVDIASRMLYGEPFPDNLNGTDFVPQFFRRQKEKLTVALLGARRENALAAAEKLSEQAPQHEFVFLHDGYFGARDEEAILEQLRALKPHVLLVAMGVPRQELWIADHIGPEHCTVPIAVGALLDFLSGAVPRAPLWVRRLRLEWLFRLGLEPRRLWRRYVVGNPVFLLRVLRQRFLGRRGRV